MKNSWIKIEYHQMHIPDEYNLLPKDDQTILIFDEGSGDIVMGGLWRGDNFRDYNKNGSYISWGADDDDRYWKRWNPTHWQYLPQKPEGE